MIAERQVERERLAARSANACLFCDTSPLTTLFYSQELFGRASPRLEALATRRYDITVLCSADFPFVQDGTRRDRAFREQQTRWYQQALTERGVPFVSVGGTIEQRIATTVAALHGLRASAFNARADARGSPSAAAVSARGD